MADRRPAVFLDRDGTLNEEIEYLHRPEDFRWIPGAPGAIARLNAAGLPVIVVTNQAGVAHGYFDEETVERLHAYMQGELARSGAHVDAFYSCFTHPDGRVPAYRRVDPCRKPDTGLFVRAIEEWSIDPFRSFMVGDRNTDVQPAQRLGMGTVLVRTGYGAREEASTTADLVVADIGEAVQHILEPSTTTR